MFDDIVKNKSGKYKYGDVTNNADKKSIIDKKHVKHVKHRKIHQNISIPTVQEATATYTAIILHSVLAWNL